MCSTVQEQITTCGQNAIVKIGERTNIRPQKITDIQRNNGDMIIHQFWKLSLNNLFPI